LLLFSIVVCTLHAIIAVAFASIQDYRPRRILDFINTLSSYALESVALTPKDAAAAAGSR